MGNEMETNQVFQQKRIWFATVLVAIVVVINFLCIKVNTLDKRLDAYEDSYNATVPAFLETEPSNGEMSVNEGEFAKETGRDELQDVVQPTIEPIEVQRPEDVTEFQSQALHKVYLTFDDGPSKNTEAILDILDEYGVKATFFVVGKEDGEAAQRLQMIYERGHTIGMHSFSHDYSKIYHSVEEFREDFLALKQYIYDATGVETTYFRFPGGSSNQISELNMTEFVTFIEEQGVEYYDWNVSSGDGTGKLIPVEMLVKNCTEMIPYYETSIILLHDSAPKTTTVEALPQIIETILAMEDTVILPITENTRPIHHVIKGAESEEPSQEETTTRETEAQEEIDAKESAQDKTQEETAARETAAQEEIDAKESAQDKTQEETATRETAAQEEVDAKESAQETAQEGTTAREDASQEALGEENAVEDASQQETIPEESIQEVEALGETS